MTASFTLARPDDFDGWRKAARIAFASGISPEQVIFEVAGEDGDLFGAATPSTVSSEQAGPSALTVPASFVQLAKQVVCHSDPERFALLYRLLVRLQHNKTLLNQGADKDVHRINALAKEVRRDRHKMRAFVRFRKTGEAGDVEQFVAWFEPTHHIMRLNAQFFVRRFANMHWSILSPKGCVHWDTDQLTFSDPVPKSEAPTSDALEEYWKTYYASIFNPARLKIGAMTSEMPKKYWKNLPEAELIPALVAKAQTRETSMRDAAATQPKAAMMAHLAESAVETFPARSALSNLADFQKSLKGCRDCPLWKPATQAVPGHGLADADLMLVGEQPGDLEDLQGEPFIGPAGRLLREVLAELGQEMDQIYVTNAVKHFKFWSKGKQRLHKNPNMGEIDRCSWWLKKEIELVQPKVIVALGASALHGITGKSQAVKSMRGIPHPLQNGSILIVANHPAFILRLKGEKEKAAARRGLQQDLDLATKLLAGSAYRPSHQAGGNIS